MKNEKETLFMYFKKRFQLKYKKNTSLYRIVIRRL